uniref:Src homology 2 domain containing transforming protein D, a n=1 Tax=Erpetoichthys calabaricus TaxID=27687 RepID=A0A8C4TAN1_ERPCA
MAKWLRDYLNFGSRRVPPQPPKPDYTESEILKAYRAQKNLDFEDPYEDAENKPRLDGGQSDIPPLGSPVKAGSLDTKFFSPKHRLIKVDSQELNRSGVPSGSDLVPDPVVVFAPDRINNGHICVRPRPPEEDPESQTENNGYMEPYEAQRVITELQKKSGSDRQKGSRSKRGVQLYDVPYEENKGGSDSDGGGPQHVRESRLPQDDERPADEYDQPWEWKKDHISKAFAVQFDGADWDRSSPPKERLRHTKQSPQKGSSKFRKASGLEAPTMLGERVDPTLPLDLGTRRAESLLTLCKECSYLVRNSETSRSDFSLSLRSSQGFMHMKFSRSKEGKYILGQNSPPFDNVPEVIHYYTTHKLPIKGAEHLSLLFPVLVQTL